MKTLIRFDWEVKRLMSNIEDIVLAIYGVTMTIVRHECPK